MNAYKVQFLIIVFGFSFCGMRGMENEKQLSMIERKVTTCAVSKLLFADKEKILHIGVHCEKIIQQKAHDAQIYCIDTHTLNMMEKPAVGYDKVLTFACWDVVKKPQESFDNGARLLKRHGQFCAVLPYDKSPYINIYYQTFMNDTWKEFYDNDKEVKLCGSRAMKKLFEGAGIGDRIACEIIKKPFIFKTKEKFMAWIASYSSELNGIIPQERQVEFMNDVINNYLEKYPVSEDKSIKLYLPYMIVSGYKS